MQSKRAHFPEKAIILCAGYGTRMDIIGSKLPKALLPFWGIPMIMHIINILKIWGIKQILINIHHQPDPLLNYILKIYPRDININISFEPEIAGTGGALKRASWYIDRPTIIMNSDVIMSVDPDALNTAYSNRKHIAAAWLTDKYGPRTVEASNRIISNFRSLTPGKQGTFTFCGLHIVGPEIINYFPDKYFFSIIDAYENAMNDNKSIAGICIPDSFWADIGSPDNYIKAHNDIYDYEMRSKPSYSFIDRSNERRCSALIKNGVKIAGLAVIGKNVKISKGAFLEDSIIWDNSTIGPKSVITHAVIQSNTRINCPVDRIAAPSENILEKKLPSILHSINWDYNTTTAIPLPPRASARTFYRLQHKGKSAILMKYELSRQENVLYFKNAEFLAKIGIRVPKTLIHDSASRLAVIQDLGDLCLTDYIKYSREENHINIYEDILSLTLKLHSNGYSMANRIDIKLADPFTAGLYKIERELFSHFFLEKYLKLNRKSITSLIKELSLAGKMLLKHKSSLIHRDLQSSNIIIFGGKPYFIDFQGMRYGSAYYDLASLIYDPYVNLSEPIQDSLIKYYAERSGTSFHATKHITIIAGIQRLCQALGAFGRMATIPGAERFTQHIKPALTMLNRCLGHTDEFPLLKSECPLLLELSEKHS